MEYKGYEIRWEHNELGSSYVSVYFDGEWQFNDGSIDEACREIDRMEESDGTNQCYCG